MAEHTIEERLVSLERMVRRLAPRPEKRIIGLIPWLPISGKVTQPSEEGECFSFMFPLSGKVRRLLIALGEQEEGKEAIFEISLTAKEKKITDIIEVKKRRTLITEYEVVEGMQASIKTKAAVKDVWVSFLFEPSKEYYTPMRGEENADT